MDNNWTVYRHISPSGNIYIGITKQNVLARWSSGSGYRPCVLFYKAIKKYGWDNIKHEILFTNLTEDKAKDLEIKLIRHYKNLGISYNITDGGQGCSGRVVSKETREKISKYHSGKVISKEVRSKISETLKSKPSRSPRRPYKLSEKAKQNIGKGHLGLKYKRTQEWKNKIVNHAKSKRKAVLQLDKDTLEIIAEYPSTLEAAEAVNASRGNIGNCCSNRSHVKTVKGFKWKYKDE